jgi:hypothetical protein
MAPDTTCIGPFLSSRQAPTLILNIPERPLGNREECQPKKRSELINPEISNPNRLAKEDRTCSGLSVMPSILFDFKHRGLAFQALPHQLNG